MSILNSPPVWNHWDEVIGWEKNNKIIWWKRLLGIWPLEMAREIYRIESDLTRKCWLLYTVYRSTWKPLSNWFYFFPSRRFWSMSDTQLLAVKSAVGSHHDSNIDTSMETIRFCYLEETYLWLFSLWMIFGFIVSKHILYLEIQVYQALHSHIPIYKHVVMILIDPSMSATSRH